MDSFKVFPCTEEALERCVRVQWSQRPSEGILKTRGLRRVGQHRPVPAEGGPPLRSCCSPSWPFAPIPPTTTLLNKTGQGAFPCLCGRPAPPQLTFTSLNFRSCRTGKLGRYAGDMPPPDRAQAFRRVPGVTGQGPPPRNGAAWMAAPGLSLLPAPLDWPVDM